MKDEKLLTFYGLVLDKGSREGDAVWARSNILAALNIGLFATFGFLYLNPGHPPEPALIYSAPFICVAGIVHSVSTIVAVAHLWGWTDFWKKRSKRVETHVIGNSEFVKFADEEEYDAHDTNIFKGRTAFQSPFGKVLKNQTIHLFFFGAWVVMLVGSAMWAFQTYEAALPIPG